MPRNPLQRNLPRPNPPPSVQRHQLNHREEQCQKPLSHSFTLSHNHYLSLIFSFFTFFIPPYRHDRISRCASLSQLHCQTYSVRSGLMFTLPPIAAAQFMAKTSLGFSQSSSDRSDSISCAYRYRCCWEWMNHGIFRHSNIDTDIAI